MNSFVGSLCMQKSAILNCCFMCFTRNKWTEKNHLHFSQLHSAVCLNGQLTNQQFCHWNDCSQLTSKQYCFAAIYISIYDIWTISLSTSQKIKNKCKFALVRMCIIQSDFSHVHYSIGFLARCFWMLFLIDIPIDWSPFQEPRSVNISQVFIRNLHNSEAKKKNKKSSKTMNFRLNFNFTWDSSL